MGDNQSADEKRRPRDRADTCRQQIITAVDGNKVFGVQVELHDTVSHKPVWFHTVPLRAFKHRLIPGGASSQLAYPFSNLNYRPPTRGTHQKHKNLHWHIFNCMWNLHVCMGQVEIIRFIYHTIILLVQMKAFLFASNQ